ncbi:MAG TPA: thiamine pyrophosphate-dependent enzyme, partial [Candidatus Gracilibacteria bacterium]|nr:thiamine pyrophosphate-dependent enzyme [Candidatus Gracilibacteria bacterium]
MQAWNVKNPVSWCPGCGNYGLLLALKRALVSVGAEPHNTAVIAGIGCGALLPYWIKTYGFCSLHGRAIPVASGVKMANQNLQVIVNGGDGDIYGIGMGHLNHLCRRNLDLTVIVNNNGVYGLTKGQTSPTTPTGIVTNSTPQGNPDRPVNGLALAFTMGATFVARSYYGDVKHLQATIEAALKHKGTAIIDVLEICFSFNKFTKPEDYKEKLKYIEKPAANRL